METLVTLIEHIKDYLIFAFTMNIRQIIIAVNKMDITKDSKYSEIIFNKIKKYMINLCINIGFNNNIQVIAYSGYTGQHITFFFFFVFYFFTNFYYY